MPPARLQPDAVKNMYKGKPARPDLLEDFRDARAQREASGNRSGRRRRDPPGSRGLFGEEEDAAKPASGSGKPASGKPGSSLPWEMAKGNNAPEVKGKATPSDSATGSKAGGSLPWDKKASGSAKQTESAATSGADKPRRDSSGTLPWDKPRKGRGSSDKAAASGAEAGGYAPSFGAGAGGGRAKPASGMKGPKATLPWAADPPRMRSGGRSARAAELDDEGLESIAI